MSLKAKKLDQVKTEMFISEFEIEESPWNVISEINKNSDAKKASFKGFPELFEMSGNQGVYIKYVGGGAGDLRPANLLKKRLWHRCSPANFVKFLRTSFFMKKIWWLRLKMVQMT